MSNATVAIIGGGFSGTVAAIRLLSSPQRGGPYPALRQQDRADRARPCRRGARLSARVPTPGGSTCPPRGCPRSRSGRTISSTFARGRNPLVSGGDFLPRAWYGDYLSDRLELARRRSPRWLSFEQVRARATASTSPARSARICALRRRTVRGRPRAARARQLAGRGAARSAAAGRERRLEPALDGAPADLRAARAARRHRAHDDRPCARDRRAPARRAHHGDLAAWPAAAAARGRARPARVEIRRHGPARPRPAVASACASSARRSWPPAATGARRCSRCAMSCPRSGAPRRGGCGGASCATCARTGTCTAIACRRRRCSASSRCARKSGSTFVPAASSRRVRIKDGIVVAWRPRGSETLSRGALRRRRQRHGTGRQPEALVLRPRAVARGPGPVRAGRPRARLGHGPGRAPVRCERQRLGSAVLRGPLLRARHWEATAVPELRAHVAAHRLRRLPLPSRPAPAPTSAASPRPSSAASSRPTKKGTRGRSPLNPKVKRSPFDFKVNVPLVPLVNQFAGLPPLTIQFAPYLSVSMPKDSTQKVLPSGMTTLPPADERVELALRLLDRRVDRARSTRR